jgi:hypothetical protein
LSSLPSRDQAYEAFLSSSGLEIWTTSLGAYRELFEGDEDVREAGPVDIRCALTIAFYVAWLSMRCGEDGRRDCAMAYVHSLSARLARVPPFGGREGTLIEAVIAAAKGYQAAARRLMKEIEAPPVEIALLAVPAQAMPRAAGLKPFILDGSGHRFVPALYFYGSALLDLGYQSSAHELLKRHRELAESSLVIDLRGQLLELAGEWSEARDKYDNSEWASHFYRCSVCDLILGGSVDRLAQWPPETVKKFTAGMADFSGETDRAGVLRSASFVRACRWTGFDNWLVLFELGRLGFQRRHHTEAERYLAAAVHAAPEPFRFPIHSLRFANLTWLRSATDADTNPEALEAGYAALLEPAREDQRAQIRTWIGRFPGESEVLDPVPMSDDDYEIGNAHQIRGSVPEAVARWCACIARSNTPRAFHQLLRTFASFGFERTASRLAETVALEFEDSFFELWELADTIAGVLEEQPASRVGGGFLNDQLVKVEARLEELVGSEFQNAVRAFDHFLKRHRLGPARSMLARAERLAEGSEELLLLAIARRRAAAGGWDPRALDALHLAQRQSKDRFERLLIARELVAFGDHTNARTILNEEEVFSGKKDMAPIEYVLALQCAKLCARDEEQKLLDAAATESLKRDVAAGRFLRYGKRFLDRLNEYLAGGLLEIALPARPDAPEVQTSDWHEMMTALERFRLDRQGEPELRLLNEKVTDLSGADSPWSRFALWGLHLDRFDAHLQVIDRLRPPVGEDETPMARDLSFVRSRAQQVAQLWRAHLLATEPSHADRQLDDIRVFLEEEKALTGQWDRLRNVEAEEPTRYALGYAEQGASLLAHISSDEGGALLWPPFLDLQRAVVEDAQVLATRLQERAAALRQRLAV